MSVRTGSVIPLGDGSVGKSVIMQLLKEKEMTEVERIKILNEASLASRWKRETNSSSSLNAGSTRFKQTRCSNPPAPARVASNVSAIPPTPKRRSK